MTPWQPDALLPGFEALELEFPDDYDGRVLATLVRLPVREAPRGAVLWVHGFIDYFFQRHVAERFAMEGYAFYALDLRKHGRSLRPHQHANFCKNLAEYYPDITRSLDVIGEPVLLAGHSTGGLIGTLYAHDGPHRERVQALWLNSPFFDWNLPDWRRTQMHMAAALGRFFPYINDLKALLPHYTQGCSTRAGSSTPRSSRCRASRCTTAGSAPSPTPTPRCTPGSTCAARCSPCIPTRPTSCSTGGISRAGRAASAPTSPCSRFRARSTTSPSRAPRSARRCSGSSSPGRNEP